VRVKPCGHRGTDRRGSPCRVVRIHSRRRGSRRSTVSRRHALHSTARNRPSNERVESQFSCHPAQTGSDGRKSFGNKMLRDFEVAFAASGGAVVGQFATPRGHRGTTSPRSRRVEPERLSAWLRARQGAPVLTEQRVPHGSGSARRPHHTPACGFAMTARSCGAWGGRSANLRGRRRTLFAKGRGHFRAKDCFAWRGVGQVHFAVAAPALVLCGRIRPVQCAFSRVLKAWAKLDDRVKLRSKWERADSKRNA